VQEIVQRQNHGMVADFILCLGADICCLICRKKLLYNRTAIAKVTANVIGVHFISTCSFNVHDALNAFT